MDDLRVKQLTDGGIDVNEALGRFMGNEGLLERFLKKFAEDENYEKLKEAVKDGRVPHVKGRVRQPFDDRAFHAF